LECQLLKILKVRPNTPGSQDLKTFWRGGTAENIGNLIDYVNVIDKKVGITTLGIITTILKHRKIDQKKWLEEGSTVCQSHIDYGIDLLTGGRIIKDSLEQRILRSKNDMDNLVDQFDNMSLGEDDDMILLRQINEITELFTVLDM